MATVFEPIRPVPPMTTIFMIYHPVSTSRTRPTRKIIRTCVGTAEGRLRSQRKNPRDVPLVLETLQPNLVCRPTYAGRERCRSTRSVAPADRILADLSES